jgi:hypothetical protein
MNEEDLRDCFAMMVTVGQAIHDGTINPKAIWEMADAILAARNSDDEEGIAVIKKRKYVRKN